ncbi:hypothetical protein LOD99_12941 [Oopsacas minuta]|uniref:PPM-type phosphatase domain-containing protein n=1 Tax=Oopsacas minuta TaxID=111878 RepID=A0AAV7JAD4_9METZ|nr:hypothetical protein LOD99_12941 [Oopsacas minuta]
MLERKGSPNSFPDIFKSSNFVQIKPEFIKFPKSHEVNFSSFAPIPFRFISYLEPTVISAYTGPEAGITWQEDAVKKHKSPTEHNGIHWGQKWNQNAYGVAVSLYEEDKTKGRTVGEPIADVFGVVRRKNCSFMALADGCGWGVKPRLAARSAVRAALDHLNSKLQEMRSTHKICKIMIDAMFEAQQLILDNDATLTTLLITVVCPMKSENGTEWAALSLSLGDSSSFVYDPNTKLIRALQARVEREGVTDCGGCLGPQVGIDPDLDNLVISYSRVQPNEIVFLVSDGITDNFDTRFNTFAEPKIEIPLTYGKFLQKIFKNSKSLTRVEKIHLKMSEVVKDYFSKQEGIVSTSQELCVAMVNYALSATQEKRSALELALSSDYPTRAVLREKNPELHEKIKSATGKLDHASIVACCVGEELKHVVASRRPTLPKSKSVTFLDISDTESTDEDPYGTKLKSKPEQIYSTNYGIYSPECKPKFLNRKLLSHHGNVKLVKNVKGSVHLEKWRDLATTRNDLTDSGTGIRRKCNKKIGGSVEDISSFFNDSNSSNSNSSLRKITQETNKKEPPKSQTGIINNLTETIGLIWKWNT